MLIEAISQTTDGHVYILNGNDDLNIAAGITIESTATDAVTTWQGQHTVTVSGRIISHDDGINTIGTIDAQTIIIAAGASIVSGADGVIEDSDGVILDGINSVLTNRGSITSHGSAFSLFVHDGGTTTVANYGNLTATKYGVWNKFGSGTLNFTNYGTVDSPLGSFRGGEYMDVLTNKGMMRGTVDLGGGNDLYIGTGGTVVGQINGGSGDDRFVLGSKIERIDGGFDTDTLDFSALSSAITVDLANSANNRGAAALGDAYTGIEIVSGTTRNDILTGDAFDNTLIGNSGADRLSGGAGQDVLIGGASRDYLTGGDGGDVFVFNSTAGLGDYILDFDRLSDLVRLEGAAFGFGSYEGAVSADDFVTAATNASVDLTDRFIFRTTDASLWFDRDGKGGAASVMIADLQAGAVIDFWNMLIS